MKFTLCTLVWLLSALGPNAALCAQDEAKPFFVEVSPTPSLSEGSAATLLPGSSPQDNVGNQPAIAPPLISETAAKQPPPFAGGPVGEKVTAELDLMVGGNFILNSDNPVPNNYGGVTSVWNGGYGPAFGVNGGVYFPVDPADPDWLLGGNLGVYFTGVSNHANPASYGYGGGVTERADQSEIELAFGTKYRFNGNDVQPYFLGGVGCALISSSASVTTAVSSYGTTVTSGISIPSTSSLSPLIQLGFGIRLPAGDDVGYFVEGRSNVIFVQGASQSTDIAGYGTVNYQGPSYVAFEFPVNIGLNFSLK